jgi:hypothetical protein
VSNDKVGLILQPDEAYLLLTLLTRAVHGSHADAEKANFEAILQRLAKEWSKTDEAARARLEVPIEAIAHTY